MQRTRCAAGVIAAIVLATPWIAEARPKTDRAVFLNGDVLTGEIKSLDRGKLRYSTNAMGTVSIEWDDLESIESTYCYRMRLRNGTRYFGSVTASDREGHVRIVTRPKPVDIPWFDLVAIAPLEDTFLDQLDTYLNTGYSYTKASDVSEFNLGAELTFTTDYTINRLEARSIITDNGGETTNSSQINLSRQRWLKRPQHFNVTFGGFETNDELAIDYRVAVGEITEAVPGYQKHVAVRPPGTPGVVRRGQRWRTHGKPRGGDPDPTRTLAIQQPQVRPIY